MQLYCDAMCSIFVHTPQTCFGSVSRTDCLYISSRIIEGLHYMCVFLQSDMVQYPNPMSMLGVETTQ